MEIVDPFDTPTSNGIVDPFDTQVAPEVSKEGGQSFLKQKWNDLQAKHAAILGDVKEHPLDSIVSSFTAPMQAGWNLLATPLIATAGGVAGAVVEGAKGNNPLYALADYFKKTAEASSIPENKQGEYLSAILSTPFEAIQKLGEAGGDPVYENLKKAGFKDEVAAGAGAAVQGLINLAGMTALGKAGSKALSPKEVKPTTSMSSIDDILAEIETPPEARAPLEGLPKNSKQMLYPGQKPFGPREPAQGELPLDNSPETVVEQRLKSSPQEDLFSTDNKQSLQNFEVQKKAGEVDQAYSQKEAEQKQEAADTETRQQLAAIPDEAIDASLPSQSSARMPRGVGAKQGGAVGFKPTTLEEKAKAMPRDEWVTAFAQERPDKAHLANQVYDKLNPPVTNLSTTLSENPILKGIGKVGDTADYGLGVISTRIRNINAPLEMRAQKFEMDNLKNTSERIKQGDPFFTTMNKVLSEPLKEEMNGALLDNDTSKIQSIAKKAGVPQIGELYKGVRNVMEDIGSQLKDTGRLSTLRPDYFPRIVKDVPGLLNALDFEHKTAIETRLKKAADAAKKRGEVFAEEDSSKVINSYLSGHGVGSKPGFTQTRYLENVPPELRKYYYSPTETFHSYVKRATQDIETRRFFGKDTVLEKDTGKINLDDSIGKMTNQLMDSGEITPTQAVELGKILNSRFGPGNRGSNWGVQTYRDINNISLIGDFSSAFKQTSDTAAAAYQNGFKFAFQAAVRQLTGKSLVNPRDFGFIDHISEEFVSQRATTKAVNFIHKTTGFSQIDLFGKGMMLNSSLLRARAQVKTPAGVAKLSEEWGKSFDNDFPQLVKDLQEEKNTPLTDLYAWSSVAKFQPISRLEVPQAFLDNPNGRVFYTLKSFSIKQGDVIRRDAYNNIKEGKTALGLKKLARYVMILGVANATNNQIVDWLMGKDTTLEASDVPMSVLKNFGYSEFLMDKLKAGQWSAVAGIVLPPWKIADDVGRDIMNYFHDEEVAGKSVKYIPWIGKYLYNKDFGGAEAANDRAFDKDIGN